MPTAGVVLITVAGLFAGSAIWAIARAQAAPGTSERFRQPGRERQLAREPRSGSLPASDSAHASHVATQPGAHTARRRFFGTAVGWLPLLGAVTGQGGDTQGGRQGWLRVGFEVAVAVYMGLLAVVHGWDFDLAVAAVFSVPLLVVLLVDWWTRLIYTNVIGLGLILALGAAAAEGWSELVNAAISAMGTAVVFGLLFVTAALLSRNVRFVPFGPGDVFLAAMIGAMVRFPAVVWTLSLGVFSAGLILLVLLVTKRVSPRTAVPYGPFLCAGALVSLAISPG